MSQKVEKTKDVQEAVQVETERAQFTSLLQANPNYFGTLAASPLAAAVEMAGNTKYEALTCLGYNPAHDTLEATVAVKQATGYKGNLCQAGSTEYVRFYIDYGSGWEDLGLIGFAVHDIPTEADCRGRREKPLLYAATLPFEPRRKFCGSPVLPTVRAILSWEIAPPPNQPNWPPVWGDVVDRPIQIRPRTWFVSDLIDLIAKEINVDLKLPPQIEAVQNEPIPQPQPDVLQLAELTRRYGAAEGRAAGQVEPHRFALAAAQTTLIEAQQAPQSFAATVKQWEKLNLNLEAILAALEKTKGNVSYEELDCVALDPNREWLTATFRIKESVGYSGSLCEKGSREYVAFWADWNDTCSWTYLGTVPVNVHDIDDIPADGLHYTAVLPVDLAAYRQPCSEPKIGRVRAVLSWNAAPSTTDPDQVPHWGNRVDAHVQIKPGPTGGPQARISILGGVGLADINTGGNGMTTPTAKMSPWGTNVDAHGRQCPFGGLIEVSAPPNVGYKYRVWVREAGVPASEQIVKDKIWVVDQFGVGSYHNADPVSGFFTYLPVTQNVENLLALWRSGADGLYEIRLEMANMANVVVDSTPWYHLRIDNTKPDAQITIDGGACHTYTPGVTITGRFVARDAHFGSFTLDTLPASMTPPSPTTATPSTAQTAVAPGDVWQLDTTGMAPCGYVVRVRVSDRTVVDSKPGSHNRSSDDRGFCLLTPTEG